MRLSHIHEDDKLQADPLEVRIVVKNDIPEELSEPDNPLDSIKDEFGERRVIASILVEIWHNTKGKLETHTRTFNMTGGPRYPFKQAGVSHRNSRPAHMRLLLPRSLHEGPLMIAYGAWYTMHYSKPRYTNFIRNDNQWLIRPMRSEFTLTWDQFMEQKRRIFPTFDRDDWPDLYFPQGWMKQWTTGDE